MKTISCELWSINRILRWTGFRLYVQMDVRRGDPFDPKTPTRIGIGWYGWKQMGPWGVRPV